MGLSTYKTYNNMKELDNKVKAILDLRIKAYNQNVKNKYNRHVLRVKGNIKDIS